MSYTIDKFGAGDNDSNGDYPLTKNQAKVLLKKLTDQKIFYELEPIEVLDVFVDLEDDFPFTDENDNPDVNRIGTIRGRYVVSEHDQQVEDGYFFPLDQNVIQYPVVGEVVIGFEFNDNRYYFSKLPAELNLPPRSVDFNISNTSGLGNNFNTLNQNTPLDQYRSGRYFIPDKDVTRLTPREGDTIISGRFGNTIRLGHNKIEKSPNIKLVAGGFKNNDEPYFENLQNDNSSIYMTSDEKVDYPEPVVNYIDKDYTKPQLVFNSDRIVINAKKENIYMYADKKVSIKGVGGVDVENLSGGVNLIAQEIKRDYVGGLTKDISYDLNDPDKVLLPKQSIELAKQMEPFITYIKGEIQAMAYLLLPPTLPGGIPNPSFMLGMKIKFETLQKLIKKIQEFNLLEFLPKFDFETVSLSEFREALGLDGLSIDFPTDEWEQFYDDIDGLKQKVLDIQNDIESKLQSITALGDAFDALKQGSGTTESFINALDAYESDPNNTPVDTTDIRDIIADGAGVEDVQRYLEQGGSPQVQEAIQLASTQKDEAQQLNQIVKIIELTKQ